MYELLDAAGATLCDPLLIILLAVMMMPSGGSSYVFSGKTDDVGFLLLKARAAARKRYISHSSARIFVLCQPFVSKNAFYQPFVGAHVRPSSATRRQCVLSATRRHAYFVICQPFVGNAFVLIGFFYVYTERRR